MRKLALALISALVVSALFFVQPVETVSGKLWTQKKYSDFDDGSPWKTAARSDGLITLAPKYKSIYKVKAREHIWASDVDSVGNLILGTGSPAAVYKIAPSGQELWKTALEGVQVSALVRGRDNVVYAAVIPDGDIYRIDSKGNSNKYFSCKEKYVWSLALDSKGNLYAATGVKGRIYKITGKDDGKVFATIDDTHVISLVAGKDDTIFGGTDEKGYVFKIDKSGKVFVMYDADEREIKSIYYDNKTGDVYFTAINEGLKLLPSVTNKAKKSEEKKNDPGEAGQPTVSVSTEFSLSANAVNLLKRKQRTPVKSGLYKIDSENRIIPLFKTSKTTMHTISRFGKNEILVGGGEKGRLYSYDMSDKFSLLMEVEHSHITSLSAFEGNTYICTSNGAEVYLMENGYPAEGYFYSSVEDTGTVSKWGVVKWNGEMPAQTNIRLYTRTGNTETPNETWSAWSSPYLDSEGARIVSPQARFIQWRALLKTLNKNKAPSVDSVTISYLPLNLQPEIKDYKLYPKGVAIKERRDFDDGDDRLEEALNNGDDSNAAKMKPLSLGKRYFKEGALTILWKVEDENDDSLQYTLYYRGEKENDWKILEKEYDREFYTWDTKSVADGKYYLKIVADDSPSTPAEMVKKAEKITELILVDNTGPEVTKPVVTRGTKDVTIKFSAVDGLTPVTKCFYSVNGGTWKVLFPVDGIGDTLKENYETKLNITKKGEYTVVFKVQDDDGNISTASANFKF